MKDCVSCVHEYLSPMSDTCRECGIAMLNYEEAKPKPITNYDLIRAKSVEEMAEFMANNVGCDDCRFFATCRSAPQDRACADKWLDWLRQEADDGNAP